MIHQALKLHIKQDKNTNSTPSFFLWFSRGGMRWLPQAAKLIKPTVFRDVGSPIRGQTRERNPTHCLHDSQSILGRQWRIPPALVFFECPPHRPIRFCSPPFLLLFLFVFLAFSVLLTFAAQIHRPHPVL
uniref:Uncharacterized protein n=1 Tax=Opuntia streptacantha TaxID=393608 RepID=A0A7C9A9D9_OPUST